MAVTKSGPIDHADIARFERFITKTDGCWLWLGTKDRKGYGKFSMPKWRLGSGKSGNCMVGAHRFSYMAFVGQIVEMPGFHGACILHRCDMPSCVKPEHLFVGSNADNVRDMRAKGRAVDNQPKGSAHAMAILREEQVHEIFAKRKCGASQKDIAREYGISHVTVSAILVGRLWAHLGLSL